MIRNFKALSYNEMNKTIGGLFLEHADFNETTNSYEINIQYTEAEQKNHNKSQQEENQHITK